MPRIARIVVPGIAHHVTQRGNRRQDVFFSEIDYKRYLEWLEKYAHDYRLKIWAYCLMTNHVHLVAVPEAEDSLTKTLRNLHTRHSNRINSERGWQGHLWQGRFFSCVLDDFHLAAAVRYVECNPVRAGLVKRAEEYLWSSAAAHCETGQDSLLSEELPLMKSVDDWALWLAQDSDHSTLQQLRSATEKGLPCGSKEFIEEIENILGRRLVGRSRGRPRKELGKK